MLKKLTSFTVLAGTLLASSLQAATLHYAGSDFLAGKAEDALKACVTKISPNTTLTGDLFGSKIALEQLREGKIDFALLMLQDPMSVPELKDKTWRANALGYQVAYLVVPRSNPTEELSLFQLRGIFANFSEAPLKTWNQISPKITGTPKIQPIVSAPNDSASSVAVQSLVFPRADYHPDVRKTANDDNTVRALMNTANGIAIVSAPPQNQPSLKTLAVSPANQKGETGTAYQPIASNIYNRDYPLAIQFFVVYPQKNREKILPVLQTILSDEFAKSLEKATLTPLPKNIREMLKKNIDEKGK